MDPSNNISSTHYDPNRGQTGNLNDSWEFIGSKEDLDSNVRQAALSKLSENSQAQLTAEEESNAGERKIINCTSQLPELSENEEKQQKISIS